MRIIIDTNCKNTTYAEVLPGVDDLVQVVHGEVGRTRNIRTNLDIASGEAVRNIRGKLEGKCRENLLGKLNGLFWKLEESSEG